jgi:hypothetical protein
MRPNVPKFDPELREDATVRVRDLGLSNDIERRLIGKTGRIVRAYIASCRVEIDGVPVTLPNRALEPLS